ncbi:hypothetical protein PV325_000873 [Microctonus aethiopoides]|nr:hypothetical protein PV325_000873 [Microctonus aethiopoides]
MYKECIEKFRKRSESPESGSSEKVPNGPKMEILGPFRIFSERLFNIIDASAAGWMSEYPDKCKKCLNKRMLEKSKTVSIICPVDEYRRILRQSRRKDYLVEFALSSNILQIGDSSGITAGLIIRKTKTSQSVCIGQLGAKAVLYDRLMKHTFQLQESAVVGETSRSPDTEAGLTEEFKNLTIKELKGRLARLGLEITGNKTNIRDRLRKALDGEDEIPEEEEEEAVHERRVNVEQTRQEQSDHGDRYSRAVLSFEDVEDAL